MFALLPFLMQAASFAPALAKFFGAGDTGQKIAEHVGEIAQSITGAKTPEEALAGIAASEEKKQQFQLAVNAQMQNWDAMYLADVQNARSRDVEIRKTGQKNYRADTMYILAVLVIVGITYLVWTTPQVDDFIKGVATLILGRFLGYLDGIYNFEFGSTRTSRDKDETIKQLSKES